MEITIDATYENGVLKPHELLPLDEHQRVRVTVQVEKNWVQRTAGMIKWTGDTQLLDQLIMDPELDPQERA